MPLLSVGSLERAIFDAINEQRRKQNLLPLLWAEDLAVAARAHSTAMARRNFFAHDVPRGAAFSARMHPLMAGRSGIAENLFQSQGYADPVQTAVEGWLQSPGHRRNLLNPAYNETGVGAAVSEDKTLYFTQIFATRRWPAKAND